MALAAFMLEAAPQPLDKDAAHSAAIAIDLDLAMCIEQHVN